MTLPPRERFSLLGSLSDGSNTPHAEREKRLEGLAVRVLVAVGERDAAVARADRRAGQALREMTEDEGLSVHEAVEWCGDEITTREATRLRHLAQDGMAIDPKVDVRN